VILFTLLLVFLGTTSAHATGLSALDCTALPCAEVLPGAHRFESIQDKPYQVGLDLQGKPLGWVGLSSDVIEIYGYSGKELHTLVGVDENGIITGAKVVKHSEPILLVGIPEAELDRFVAGHVGLSADQRVSIGKTSRSSHHIDGVSGATVTVLSETRTILETARVLVEDLGILRTESRRSGHFTTGSPLKTWSQVSKHLGHLTVSHTQVGAKASGEMPFIDLWFGLVDSPQLGVPLLGVRRHNRAHAELSPGEHLLVVLNKGASSFKGSGFVRGGTFDRFRLEQALRTVTFRDLDYENIPSPQLAESPRFAEAGLFIIRDDKIDPGEAYNLVYLASNYATQRGAFERDFYTFQAEHQLSPALYTRDEKPDSRPWLEAWRIGGWRAAIVAVFYLGVAGIFVARRWSARRLSSLKLLHKQVVAFSFLVLGVWLHAQPSVTQLFTLVETARTAAGWGLFLSDPVLLVSWIGIAITTVLWGRGTFCGWLCPYGSLAEILSNIGTRLKIPKFEVSDKGHKVLRNVRYLVFAALLGAFLYRADLGELFAEIEPFKTTFFVPLGSRSVGLILWWLTLIIWSLFTYRPFCRYLCPLGAALSVPSSFRLFSPYRRGFCSKCNICPQRCESRAFRPDGSINPRECLNCWECEAHWQSDQICPPLVGARRKRERAMAGRHE